MEKSILSERGANMFIRMIRGALFRQRGKMLLIAFTIALGTSLARC